MILCGHNLIETAGWITLLFSDSRGQYLIEKAQFEKQCVQCLLSGEDKTEATPPNQPNANFKPTASLNPQKKTDSKEQSYNSIPKNISPSISDSHQKQTPLSPKIERKLSQEIKTVNLKNLLSNIDSNILAPALTHYPEKAPTNWDQVEKIISQSREINEIMDHYTETQINLSKAMKQLSQAATSLQIAYARSKGHSSHESITNMLGNYQSFLNHFFASSGNFVVYSLASLKQHSFALRLVEHGKYDKALQSIVKIGEQAKKMAEISDTLVKKADLLIQDSQNALESVDRDENLKNNQDEWNNLKESLKVTDKILKEIKISFENMHLFWLGAKKYYEDPKDFQMDQIQKKEFSNEIKKSGLSFIYIGQIMSTAQNLLSDVKAHIDSIMMNLPTKEEAKKLLEK